MPVKLTHWGEARQFIGFSRLLQSRARPNGILVFKASVNNLGAWRGRALKQRIPIEGRSFTAKACKVAIRAYLFPCRPCHYHSIFGVLLDAVQKPLVNTDLMRRALEKIVNPHVLVNAVSRRVRQLNSGG